MDRAFLPWPTRVTTHYLTTYFKLLTMHFKLCTTHSKFLETHSKFFKTHFKFTTKSEIFTTHFKIFATHFEIFTTFVASSNPHIGQITKLSCSCCPHVEQNMASKEEGGAA